MTDPELFDRNSPNYDGELAFRCTQFPLALQPIDRYVNGLLAEYDPNRVVFSALTGVPENLVQQELDTAGDLADVDAILADPRMARHVGFERPIRSSCEPLTGPAQAPRRIVQLIHGLRAGGVRTVLGSLCADSYGHVLRRVSERIGSLFDPLCQPRPPHFDADGRSLCPLVETLPREGEYTRCEQLDGRLFLRTNTVGAEVCEVCQLDAVGRPVLDDPACAGANDGWFYEELERGRSCPSDRLGRVSFGVPVSGSSVGFACAYASYSPRSACPARNRRGFAIPQ